MIGTDITPEIIYLHVFQKPNQWLQLGLQSLATIPIEMTLSTTFALHAMSMKFCERIGNNKNILFSAFLLTLIFVRDKLYFVDREVYPSSAEGIGLENRQGSQIPRGFESLYLLHFTKCVVQDSN